MAAFQGNVRLISSEIFRTARLGKHLLSGYPQKNMRVAAGAAAAGGMSLILKTDAQRSARPAAHIYSPP